MIPRLYVPGLRHDEGEALLGADEQHYVRHVLRLRRGDAVRLFDGGGHEWSGTMAVVDRGCVSVLVGDPAAAAPEPLAHVTLAIGVLKADYMDEAVRDAAMIGVSRIVPLVTARSVVARGGPGAAPDRWRRVALASVRQSGRAVVPEIEAPVAMPEWLSRLASTPCSELRLLLCEPRLADNGSFDLAATRKRARGSGVIVLVGPEGGWNDAETSRAEAVGFMPWTVSARVLRADAVSLAALSVLFYAWEHARE